VAGAGRPAKFQNQPGRVKQFTNATLVDDQALAWLRTIPGQEPVFLWLHYMDPHGPYVPPEAYATRFLSDHPVEIVPVEKLPPYQLQKSLTGGLITDLASTAPSTTARCATSTTSWLACSTG